MSRLLAVFGKIWKTRSGKKVNIRNMATAHIHNALVFVDEIIERKEELMLVIQDDFSDLLLYLGDETEDLREIRTNMEDELARRENGKS